MNHLPGKNLIQATILLLLVAGSSVLSAQTREAVDVHSFGPQVGERVPDFELPDQNGQLHTLDSIMGPNSAICYLPVSVPVSFTLEFTHLDYQRSR